MNYKDDEIGVDAYQIIDEDKKLTEATTDDVLDEEATQNENLDEEGTIHVIDVVLDQVDGKVDKQTEAKIDKRKTNYVVDKQDAQDKTGPDDCNDEVSHSLA